MVNGCDPLVNCDITNWNDPPFFMGKIFPISTTNGDFPVRFLYGYTISGHGSRPWYSNGPQKGRCYVAVLPKVAVHFGLPSEFTPEQLGTKGAAKVAIQRIGGCVRDMWDYNGTIMGL